jgi:type I restriction enzyme M protein
MPDNAKEQQRAELHKTIWSIADNLRGSIDGWDFKQYVLSMFFIALLATTSRISLRIRSRAHNHTILVFRSDGKVYIRR